MKILLIAILCSTSLAKKLDKDFCVNFHGKFPKKLSAVCSVVGLSKYFLDSNFYRTKNFSATSVRKMQGNVKDSKQKRVT